MRNYPAKSLSFQHRALSPLAFGLAYVMPLIVYSQSLQGGWFYFLFPIYLFVIFPLLDGLLSHQGWILSYDYAPDPEDQTRLGKNPAYFWILWLCLPLQTGLLVWALQYVSGGNLSLVAFLGLGLSVGITTGSLGITVAHELLHQPSKPPRLLGLILLAEVAYLHFSIFHLRWHHTWAATPHDPSSARLDQSVYGFFWQSLTGAWRKAWSLEAQRLQKKNLPAWQNQMGQFSVLTCALAGFIFYLGGPWALGFFLFQSLIAISLVEIINYLQHYGLVRREIRPGVYESFQAHHAWNSRHLFSNCNLFLLQRHSDHHLHPTRPYFLTQPWLQAPQLPFSYGTMVVLALIPPLWMRIMNPKVKAYQSPSEQPPPSPETSGISPQVLVS